MTYLRRAPRPPLDLVVDHLWVFEDHEVSSDEGLLFADCCSDLMFHLGAPLDASRSGVSWRLDGAWVSGARASPIGVTLSSRRFTMVGARLLPAGLSSVLGAPAVEVVGAGVPLAEFWRNQAAEALDSIAAATTAGARLDALESQLVRRLAAAAMPHSAFAAAVAAIRARPARHTVARVCDTLGVSHKHLTRLFARHVGLSPKTFQRVCRFRQLLAGLALAPARPSWAGLALDYGFADQPHLCSEFRSFTGWTPSALEIPRSPHPDYMPVAISARPAGDRTG